MSDKLSKLHDQTRRVMIDLDLASVCLDVAWEMNDNSEYRQAIGNTFSGHISRLVFSSLVHSAVAAVLRALDKPKFASISAVLQQLEDSEVRSAVVSDIGTWPKFTASPTPIGNGDSRRRAEMEFDKLRSSLSLDLFLMRTSEEKLRNFRNREVSHSAIEMREDYPTYDALHSCIRQGDHARRILDLLIFGVVHGVEDFRDQYRARTLHFLKAVATGLGAGSENDEDPRWGFDRHFGGGGSPFFVSS